MGCAGVLVLMGCSSDEQPPSDAAPLPTVEHPKAEVPKDRDTQAVLAALRRIDPCSLVDPDGATVPGYLPDIKPLAEGPFECTIVNADRTHFVIVRFIAFPDHTRFDPRQQLVTLGGAKAYVNKGGAVCSVVLPVSLYAGDRLHTEGLGGTGT